MSQSHERPQTCQAADLCPIPTVIIPELCHKDSITASVYRTALVIPSVLPIHAHSLKLSHTLPRSILCRLNQILLAQEVNAKLFDSKVDEHHVLCAFTAPASSMEHDYERLEMLGDAYLKAVVSTQLFVANWSAHEGELHVSRRLVISNKVSSLAGLAAIC